MLVRHLKKGNLSSVDQTNQAFKELSFYENNNKYDKKAVELLKDRFSYAVEFIGEIYNIQFNIVDPEAYEVLFQTHTTPGFLYGINIRYNFYSDRYEYLLKIAHTEFINDDLDMIFINDYYAYPEDINDELVMINKLLSKNKKVSFYLASKGPIGLIDLEENISKNENIKKASEFYDNFFKDKKEKQRNLDLFNSHLKKYCNILIKHKNYYYSIAYRLNNSCKNYMVHTIIDIKTKPALSNDKDMLEAKTFNIKSVINFLRKKYSINNPVDILIDSPEHLDKYDMYLDYYPATYKFFDKVMYSK